jgi:hypothetical protein
MVYAAGRDASVGALRKYSESNKFPQGKSALYRKICGRGLSAAISKPA